MRWQVLGPVEATAGERRSDLGGGHQRTIAAALLAARGEVVPTERLIDGLWGPHPPPTARKTLQSYVSRLRRDLRALAPAAADAVDSTAGGYRVEPASHPVDADRFEALTAQAHAVGTDDPAEVIAVLEAAAALWRGPAFGELATHELVREEALRLDQLRDAATAERIDAQLALGDHDRVIGELEARVGRDPLDERAHGQLILALYRGGHQAEALATYRRLQQQLRDHSGIDPSERLQRLHERILRQDAQLAAPSPREPDRPRPPRDGPSTAATAAERRGAGIDLVGREQALAEITQLLGTTPLVTLVGPGGVGKSRLAERIASDAGEVFPDGTAVCRLAAIREPEAVATATIDALGARYRGGRPPTEALLAVLGTRRLLLVIDNCEHLLGAVAPLVEAILTTCPNVAVLATSREPLRLPTERVWQVPPLAVPAARCTAAEVADAPAGALLVARARAVEPSFELDEGTAGAIGELCRRLDGIPLAIELAAARVRAIGVEDLLARLGQRFELLTGGPHGRAGRHRTLEAVVRWSYDALDEREAVLFDRLSVFAGAFELAAVEQVCVGDPIGRSQVAGLLAQLVDRSLVSVDHSAAVTRYRLLETLRVFGAEQLAGTATTEHLRHAHATYHVAFAEEVGPRVRGPDERDALTRIDGAIDDLRLAHSWLVAQGEVGPALRLPVALRDYIGHRQRDEMFRWTERALALPGAAEQDTYPAALATAARGATRRGDLDRARRYAETAIEQVEPTSLTGTWATQALATTALYEGRLEDVLALTGRWAGLHDEPGEDYYRAMNRMLRVLALSYRGDTEAAAIEAAALVEDARAAGSDTMLAIAFYSRGEALLDTDPPAAQACLEDAIDAARRVEGRAAEGIAMVSLATLHARAGDEQRAATLFAEVIAHWRRLGDWTHQLTTLRNLVELLVRVGADDTAATLHGAVRDATPPSYGAEAERLATAWTRLERRLGAETAGAAAERGRRLTSPEIVALALRILDDVRSS